MPMIRVLSLLWWVLLCGSAWGQAFPDRAITLVVPFAALERQLLRIFGVSRPNDPHSAEEELRLLVESGEENGVLEHDEREMIHGIFEMSEVTVREVMVPRIDVIGNQSRVAWSRLVRQLARITESDIVVE